MEKRKIVGYIINEEIKIQIPRKTITIMNK
jgi:hypothetical protein